MVCHTALGYIVTENHHMYNIMFKVVYIESIRFGATWWSLILYVYIDETEAASKVHGSWQNQFSHENPQTYSWDTITLHHNKWFVDETNHLHTHKVLCHMCTSNKVGLHNVCAAYLSIEEKSF